MKSVLTLDYLLQHMEEFEEKYGRPMREATKHLLDTAYTIDPTRENWRIGFDGLEYSGPLDLRAILLTRATETK